MDRVYEYHVRVNRIIDGDTFVGDIDLGCYVVLKNQHFRLIGIDTPETDEEGFKESRDFSKKWLIKNKWVLVRSHGDDSFGRWLVTVYVNGQEITLNQALIENELAEIWED